MLASAGVRSSLRRGAGESAIARSSRSVGAARGEVAGTAGLARGTMKNDGWDCGGRDGQGGDDVYGWID